LKILVLGGSGSLGQDLKEVLSARHDVFAPPHADVELAKIDTLRRALDVTHADAVVNAAALADVDRCEREPELAWQVNADGVRWLAQVCRERSAALVHVSTDYVFDGKKDSPYLEDDLASPVQVYGKSKLAGEQNALSIASRALVVRTSWLFSRHGKNFPNRVLAAAREGGEIRAVSDWFGSPTSTVDVAMAIGALLEKGATGLVHVVNAGAQSRVEQAEEILALLGSHKARVTPIASATLLDLAARRPRYTALASARLEALGVHPRPRAEALREFVGS
jgi:dTDP-4-dehydrorhamnose reductase